MGCAMICVSSAPPGLPLFLPEASSSSSVRMTTFVEPFVCSGSGIPPASESETGSAKASGSYFFGPDAVWYVRAESEYFATKPLPTGRGSEKRDYDFFITKNLVVGCVKDGEIIERAPGKGIEPGQSLTLLAAADGVLYGTLSDERSVYDTGENVIRVVALDPETLDVMRDLGELK